MEQKNSSLFLDAPNVTELSKSSFETALQSKEVWFIMWYSPWCIHCRHFAPTWKKFSDKMSDSSNIHVGAVNCSDYKEFCRENGIRGFPTLKAMNTDKTGPEKENPYNLPGEARDLNYLVNYVNVLFPGAIKDEKQTNVIENEMNSKEQAKKETIDTEQSNADCNQRLIDALSSLHYTLANNVVVETGIIPRHRIDLLVSVLDVVARGIPGISNKMSLNRLVDEISVSDNMLNSNEWDERMSNWRVGIHQPEQGWPGAALEASRAVDDITNYTSGLWTLFHILTVSHSPMASSPSETIEAIRTVVDNFFPCKYCRSHFLHMYNSCEYGNCFIENNRDHMILWLWRMHNSVNLRVAKYRDIDDVESVMWPKRQWCPQCWEGVDESGYPKWNDQAVLLHLKSTYWCREWIFEEPTLSENVVNHFSSITYNPIVWVLAVATACFCVCVVFASNKQMNTAMKGRRRLRKFSSGRDVDYKAEV